ncbi:MAG: glutamine amidotransferase [Candidatus Tectimicrobiota bacterium]|nr:MAG: glutamine amidotransferase [Candidatus Tectomicrobia bacterium]
MRRVTVIDNFDSFTFNLVDYLRRLGCAVRVFRNDIPVEMVAASQPELLVLSPGPSTPAKAGYLMAYIDAFHRTVPIFGVCLGHQALIEYFGGSLRVLPRPYHGKQSLIEHCGTGIYRGLPSPLPVGRYHSLVGDRIPEVLAVTAWYGDVVMGVRHRQLPIEGVQFHPESILTMENNHGLRLLDNLLASLPARER